MNKVTWYLRVSLCLVALSASSASLASASPQAALSSFKQQVVAQMCADGGEWVRCFGIDPTRCASISQDLVEGCTESEVTAKVASDPATVNAAALAEGMFGCLRTKFLNRYGSQKLNTPECADMK